MKAKILAIDDDPDILDALSMVLESKGYQVTGVRDGAEAFEKLSQELPDLIILDLLMPRMDGFEFYKKLKRQASPPFKNIPILVLTSVREDASRRRYELETGEKLEVDDYLEKPFLPEVVSQRVDKLIQNKKRI